MALFRTLNYIVNHPMNKGRPISAIARFGWWQIQSRFQSEVIFDWVDGSKLAVRNGMTGATGNIYCGLHEYVDMNYVLDTLQPSELFIDVGANVGSYTVLASKVCGARTISVEPDPVTARFLRRNIEVNSIGDRVQVIEAALGAANGTVNFTIGRDTTNRVAQPGDENVRQASLLTLDEVLGGEAPTIIKIDVEGFEAEVLKGASATLANPKLRSVIAEEPDQSVLEILGSHGFARKYYDPKTRRLLNTQVYASNNAIMVR